ncbi:ABC transporter substrate-binding protein [Salarchaeum japonicum]|uniref:ABC transporter substrate-binding protein n=1 Tax=Salarchaeum japonicum TaxID=555573 RepID=A0AAV3T2M8_9EURY|nr:ABC transporter substrate-binding protein [Salarchaeum japonicum]
MSGDDIHTERTRRDYLKYGGAIVGGGLLAGCSGQSDSESPSTHTTTDDPVTATDTTTSEDERYSVTMAPAGEVAFEQPPESVFTILVHHTDMVVALGHGDALNAMYSPSNFEGNYEKILERLDGVSVDWSGLYNSWNPDKETLYELDSDIHLADPAYVSTMDAWDTADVEEVRTEIAPWFGNALSRNHTQPPDDWADRYQYYTLWEIFNNVARVFQEEERYSALADVKSGLDSTISSSIPASGERPRTARIMTAPELDTIWTFHMNGPGFIRSHTRPFGVTDVFSDIPEATTIDLEALLEADPDVILVENAFARSEEWRTVKETFHSDPVAREIQAVTNDRVYPLSARYGGPIMNLFQLEMVAKELYPEQFGEWPDYDGGPYPDFDTSEQLFDRQRVADIINGDFE